MLGFAAIGRYAIGQTTTVIPTVLGDVGAFVLDGQPALFQQTRKADVGTFTLTGQAASRIITARADVGAFTLSGQATSLETGYRLDASPTVTTVGYHVLFAALGQLPLGGAVVGGEQATTFVLSGNDAGFDRVASFGAGVGTFTLTGFDVDLLKQGYPNLIRIFPRVAFGMRGGTRGGGPQVRPSVGATVRARAFGG